MRTTRIDQPRSLDGSRKRGATSRSPSPEFGRYLSAGDTDASEEPTALHPLSALDSLLGVQEVADDGAQGRRRAATKYGSALLDHLDRLRLDLLAGGVSPASVGGLVQALRTQREHCDDPRLEAVLDEIELRAEVEMAKLGRGA